MTKCKCSLKWTRIRHRIYFNVLFFYMNPSVQGYGLVIARYTICDIMFLYNQILKLVDNLQGWSHNIERCSITPNQMQISIWCLQKASWVSIWMGRVFLSLTTGTNVKSCNRWSQLTLSACDVYQTPEHTDTSLCSSKSGASEKCWISGQQGQQKQEPLPWSWLRFTMDHPQIHFCKHNHNGLFKKQSLTMI